MGPSFIFVGPDGAYMVTLPDKDRYEDETLIVSGPSGRDAWHIETESLDASGARIIAGMTGGRCGLWFELLAVDPPEITFYGDQVIVRKDKRSIGH